MDKTSLITGITAMLLAALLAFTLTPPVRVLAFRLGAIDVPKDNRRMHKVPMPRLGGLAIFAGFSITTALFCEYAPVMRALWLGGLVIMVLGVFDDIYQLNPMVKFAAQIGASLIPVLEGVTIDFLGFGGKYFDLGAFSIPVTMLWIIGLTNAINIIDGLDGLSCGVSAICSLSLLGVLCSLDPVPAIALPVAILVGSCAGFLPFNVNPAKIFMGDTGALFLGYTLSVMSIEGVFKVHAALSFVVPISIFGLPLFDTLFAFIRRIAKRTNPFKADKLHVHHRLINMGFNVRQSVAILYAVCGILGISAMLLTDESRIRTVIVVLLGISILLVNYYIFRNPETRAHSGIDIAHNGRAAYPGAEIPVHPEDMLTDEINPAGTGTDTGINSNTEDKKSDTDKSTETEKAETIEEAGTDVR